MSLRHVPLRPSQMEISIGEKCNLACDYCFVDKSSLHTASLPQIRKAVDLFYNSPKSRYTVTFTTMEPFLYVEIWKRAVDYIIVEADRRGLDVRIITTTNGLSLNKDARDFIGRTDRRLWINASLDGTLESHNHHRKPAGSSGVDARARAAFEMALENFLALPKDRVRVICTVVPDEADRLRENMDFIRDNGFKHMDVYPNMLKLWPVSQMGALRRQLELFIADSSRMEEGHSLRLLNRLWGNSYNDKILFSSDENFYLYEGVLHVPFRQRKPYIVGNSREGIDFVRRQTLFQALFDAVAEQTGSRCAACCYNGICSFPTPLLLWCRAKNLNFEKYFANFCVIAETMIGLARRIEARSRQPTDEQKLMDLEGSPQ